VYLGYVIDAREINIDLTNMEVIMKWLVPTNVTEFRSFFGEEKYLHKFIASFSAIVAPLHAITMSGKCWSYFTHT
jgi:hypothetical protein